MPGEQPLGRERLLVVARGVEHHLDDALDMAVGGLQPADVHAETAGDRGADLLGVQLLAFDLAGLEHVRGQGLQDGLLLEMEAKGLHVADQAALLVADARRAAPPSRSRSQWNRGQSFSSWIYILRTSCGDYSA